MISDEKEDFVREYETDRNMSLLDLHNHISGSLNYDEAAPSSFFACDDGWRKLKEYSLIDLGVDPIEAAKMELPVPMAQATVADIILVGGNRILYQFDLFADRAFFIEIAGVADPEGGAEYPRVKTALGQPPAQYGGMELGAESSMFDDAMDDFAGFEGDDDYDDF